MPAKAKAKTKVAVKSAPKDKMYRLTDDRSGASTMIKTGKKGNLTIAEKDGDSWVRRAIRHCPNQRSVYVDEQDNHAEVKPIIFINGYLTIKQTYPLTQDFLDKHPSNVANGGTWFELVDEEAEAKEGLELDDLITDLKYEVKTMAKKGDEGLHELSAVVAVITDDIRNATTLGTEQLRRIINNKIDEDPYYFVGDNGEINIFDDDLAKRKYIVLRALSDGTLKKSFDGRSMLWGKGGDVVASSPSGTNLTEWFAEFLSTDDGLLVAEEIAKRS